MPSHDSTVYLLHMLEHARETVAFMQRKTREDLENDRLLNLAIIRLLEITGEAASKVELEERQRYPAIPWGQIIGLRNRLIHGYDLINLDIVWNIITTDLPPLISELETILGQNAP